MASRTTGGSSAIMSSTKYVKVTFFRGEQLDPVPAGTSKHPAVRYLDIHEGELDEKQFADWVKQASKLPGEKM